jgi:hypothetical protein
MAEEITLSSSQMTDADLRAIATYLKDLPGQTSASRATVSASDPTMTAGGAIYADECSACHGMDGKGVPYLVPLARGISERPVYRPDNPHSRPSRRRAQRSDRERADRPRHAVIRLEAERR